MIPTKVFRFNSAPFENEIEVSDHKVLSRWRRVNEEWTTNESALIDSIEFATWRYGAPIEVVFEVYREIAQRVSNQELPPLLRRRVDFICAYNANNILPMSLVWERKKGKDSVERVTLELAPQGLVETKTNSFEESTFLQMPDEVFYLGPEQHSMPLELRKTIRQRFCQAVQGVLSLSPTDGFKLFDYDKIPNKEWVYNEQSNGNSSIYLGGGYINKGYQYAQDGGYSDYSVERVYHHADRVMMDVPSEIKAEISSTLSQAIVDGLLAH